MTRKEKKIKLHSFQRRVDWVGGCRIERDKQEEECSLLLFPSLNTKKTLPVNIADLSVFNHLPTSLETLSPSLACLVGWLVGLKQHRAGQVSKRCDDRQTASAEERRGRGLLYVV